MGQQASVYVSSNINRTLFVFAWFIYTLTQSKFQLAFAVKRYKNLILVKDVTVGNDEADICIRVEVKCAHMQFMDFHAAQAEHQLCMESSVHV